MVAVKSMAAFNTLDELFGDISKTEQPEPARMAAFNTIYRVAVPHSAPRNDRWEYLRDLGSGMIGDVFAGRDISSSVWCFVFPERWMGVPEQHGFVAAIENHRQVRDRLVQRVDIVTHSALIVGNFVREQLRIVTFDPPDPW